MTEHKPKKFSRKELLEMLISQGREIERLQEELSAANEKLNSREICIRESGSLAEAALKLNHIFQDADEASRQYLMNIQQMMQQEQEALERISEKERKLQAELDRLQEVSRLG